MSVKILEVTAEPFDHFVIADFYEPEVAEALARWLYTDAPWKRAASSFYDQYELDFLDAKEMPESLAPELLSPSALAWVKTLAEELFETRLRPRVSVGAHKLCEGQGIGIHTDDAPGEESHRIVVQLSKELREDAGGNLVFFGSAAVEDVRSLFRHVFNTAIGFVLGSRSFHAVSDVARGERLTVIYGFWSASSALDDARLARTFPIR
jgi:hypothetical protein